ncbi:hypothetical protein T484DRAFT_1915637, partial [Baffinella frigidus]
MAPPPPAGLEPFSGGVQAFGGASGGFGASPAMAQMPGMAQMPEMAQMTPLKMAPPPSPAPPSTFEKLTMGAGAGALEPFVGFGGETPRLTNPVLVNPASGGGRLEPFPTSGAFEPFSLPGVPGVPGGAVEPFSSAGAVELFSGGGAVEPFDPRALEPLERARKEAEAGPGDVPRALAYAEAAGYSPAVAPETAIPLYLRALALCDPEDGPEAGSGFLSATTVRAHVRCCFGNFLVARVGNAAGAEEAFRGVLDDEPLHATAAFNLGVLLERRARAARGTDGPAYERDRKGAAAMYRRALKAEPHHMSALVNLAALLQEDGWDVAGAELLYLRVMTPTGGPIIHRGSPNGPPPDEPPLAALVNFAQLVADRGDDPERAVTLLERALQRDGGCVEAHLALASLYSSSALAEPAQAERALRLAVQAGPNHARALTRLGSLLEEEYEDEAGAEGLYQRAIRADASDPRRSTTSHTECSTGLYSWTQRSAGARRSGGCSSRGASRREHRPLSYSRARRPSWAQEMTRKFRRLPGGSSRPKARASGPRMRRRRASPPSNATPALGRSKSRSRHARAPPKSSQPPHPSKRLQFPRQVAPTARPKRAPPPERAQTTRALTTRRRLRSANGPSGRPRRARAPIPWKRAPIPRRLSRWLCGNWSRLGLRMRRRRFLSRWGMRCCKGTAGRSCG